MPGIICAIRGGPESQPTIEKAIEISKETGKTIFFLYVVNLDFLSRTSSSRTHTIQEEMREMGEFILIQAEETAKAAGVHAESVIRNGNVSEEIVTLSHEKDADYVILGRPKEEREENVFTQNRLQTFIEKMEAETGAEVVVARGNQA